MKALSLLFQKLWPRLSFFKSRSKFKVKVTKSKILVSTERSMSQGIHLCNIKSLSPFVKKLWSRLSLLWTDRRTDGQTDRQGDSYIPPPPNFVCGGYNYIVVFSYFEVVPLMLGIYK